jgi:hypothetical protein
LDSPRLRLIYVKLLSCLLSLAGAQRQEGGVCLAFCLSLAAPRKDKARTFAPSLSKIFSKNLPWGFSKPLRRTFISNALFKIKVP